jgi:hypothetical protein
MTADCPQQPPPAPEQAAAWPIADMTVPSPARIYDYLLGGKDNFASDRAAARELLAAFPDARKIARANRAFVVRALWFLAGRGIRQYLDLGTGFPTSPNVHEVARQVLPAARVVYADCDPVVTMHSRVLRANEPGVAAIQGDIRQPQDILAHPDLRELIDFAQPVAVLMVAVLHFIRPEEDPAAIVAAFVGQMAPGSYLVISHGVSDSTGPQALAGITSAYSGATAQVTPRTAGEVAAFFGGLELIEPGLVDVTQWRPERRTRSHGIQIAAGVGRKAGP